MFNCAYWLGGRGGFMNAFWVFQQRAIGPRDRVLTPRAAPPRMRFCRSTSSSFTAAWRERALTNPSESSVGAPRIARKASRYTVVGQRMTPVSRRPM